MTTSNGPVGSEKTIKVIVFGGAEKEWREWNRKFQAVAEHQGYCDVMLGITEVPPEDIDIESDEDLSEEVKKEMCKARKMNRLGFSVLLLSVKDTPFYYVDECRTSELPRGDLAKAWKKLVSKYEPKSSANTLKLLTEFHACKMGSGDEDPEPWLAKLEDLNRRLKDVGAGMPEELFASEVLSRLPSTYSEVITFLEVDPKNSD